jgi:hypothetical protein
LLKITSSTISAKEGARKITGKKRRNGKKPLEGVKGMLYRLLDQGKGMSKISPHNKPFFIRQVCKARKSRPSKVQI